MGLLTTEDNGLYVYASPLMDRTKSARSTTIRSLCAVTTSGPSMYPRNQVGRLLELVLATSHIRSENKGGYTKSPAKAHTPSLREGWSGDLPILERFGPAIGRREADDRDERLCARAARPVWHAARDADNAAGLEVKHLLAQPMVAFT